MKLKMYMVLCLLPLLAACGRKGDLVPPEAIAPPPVSDLRVVQKGDLFDLTWSRPSGKKGGGGVEEPALFRIMRREVLPAGEDCPNCPYLQIGQVDVEYPGKAARRGDSYGFRDTSVTTGTTYQYTVVPISGDGVPGTGSAVVRKKKLAPPPPSPLKVEATESDLLLSWGFEPLPENALLIGYNVYRSSNGGAFVRMTREPVADFRFRDQTVQPGVQYRYVVRAVSELEGQLIESAPSGEAGGRILSVP